MTARKKYNHLRGEACMQVRQRYQELLHHYLPRRVALFTVLEEFNIGEGTFWRIMRRKT